MLSHFTRLRPRQAAAKPADHRELDRLLRLASARQAYLPASLAQLFQGEQPVLIGSD